MCSACHNGLIALFGVQGGILMMAPHQSEEPTDQVLFSQDEGACWHTIQLDEAIDVIGIKCGLLAAAISCKLQA